MAKDQLEKLRGFLKLGNEVIGGAAGGLLGGLLAGPAGAVGGSAAGAASTPVITRGLEVAADMACRSLSVQEKRRASAATVHALNRIFERCIDGEEPRDDYFADAQEGESLSPADQIFEGMVQKCKDEHEEKKAWYISNIYANGAFTAYSFALTNRVLTIAGELSYRQLMMLAAVRRKENLGFDCRSWNMANVKTLENRGKISPEDEVFIDELFGLEKLLSYSRNRLYTDHGAERGELTRIGEVCHQLMGLHEIPDDELREMIGSTQLVQSYQA